MDISTKKNYRDRAEIFIINGENLVVGYAKEYKKILIPGGGIDPGETPMEGAVREAKEEILASVRPESIKFFSYKENELSGSPFTYEWPDIYAGMYNSITEESRKYFEKKNCLGERIYTFVAEFDKLLNEDEVHREDDQYIPTEISFETYKEYLTNRFKDKDLKDWQKKYFYYHIYLTDKLISYRDKGRLRKNIVLKTYGVS